MVKNTYQSYKADRTAVAVAEMNSGTREVNYQYQEDFLYGVLEGMSIVGAQACQDALTLLIWSFYEAIQYSQAWLPWETVKLMIALAKMQEAGNTIYAYCNFDHLGDVIAGLTSFTTFQPHTRLIARIMGGLVSDLYTDIVGYIESSESNDWRSAGKYVGDAISIIFDSQLWAVLE